MKHISLLGSTGNVTVDDILRGIVGVFELTFSSRIRGYYLTGSYADRSSIPTSDLDMQIVFKDSLSDCEEETSEQVVHHLRQISSVRLDVHSIGEEGLFRRGAIHLKIASLLIYGEDVREKIPSVPFPAYLRDSVHGPYNRLAEMRRKSERLTFPLDYPDPESEFYGYVTREARSADGRETAGVKELVVYSGWVATAILALRAGKHVGKKSDCAKIYSEYIRDEWTGFLVALHEKCRNEWGYLVPEDEASIALLKSLCRQAPAFENHFLSMYKEFLLAELQADNDDYKLFAAKRLGEIVYPHHDVIDALKALESSDNVALRSAVNETIAIVRNAIVSDQLTPKGSFSYVRSQEPGA